jgi:hypothetical protein
MSRQWIREESGDTFCVLIQSINRSRTLHSWVNTEFGWDPLRFIKVEALRIFSSWHGLWLIYSDCLISVYIDVLKVLGTVA